MPAPKSRFISEVIEKALSHIMPEGVRPKVLRPSVEPRVRAPEIPVDENYDRMLQQRGLPTVDPANRNLGEALTADWLDSGDIVSRHAYDRGNRKYKDTYQVMVGGADSFSEPHREKMRPLYEDLQSRGLEDGLYRFLDAHTTLRAWDMATEGVKALRNQAYQERLMNEGNKARDLENQAFILEQRAKAGTVAPGGLSKEAATDALRNLQEALQPDQWQRIVRTADEMDNARRDLLAAQLEHGNIDKRTHDRLAPMRYYTPIAHKDGKFSMDDNAFLNLGKVRADEMSAMQTRGKKLSVAEERLIKDHYGTGEGRFVSENPLETWLRYHQEGWREVARNRLTKAITEEQTSDFPELLWNEKDRHGLRLLAPHEKPEDGYTVAPFLKDGVTQRWQVPQSWGDAMTILQPAHLGPVLHAMAASRRTLHKMATLWNPLFLLKNPIRDSMDVGFLAEHFSAKDIPKFTLEWMRNAWQLSEGKMTKAREEFQKSGADMGYLGAYIDPMAAIMGDSKLKSFNPLKRFAGIVQNLNQATERATKETAFHMLRKKFPEMSDIELAARVRNIGSPDYLVKGRKVQENMLGDVVMFLNPAIQGAARTIRYYGNNPKVLGMHLGGVGAFAAALQGINRHNRIDHIMVDGQEVPVAGIEDVDENDRNSNIIALMPWTETMANGRVRQAMVKIPLGHAASILYGPMNRMIQGGFDAYDDPEKRNAGGFAKTMFEAAKGSAEELPGKVLPGNLRLSSPTAAVQSVVGSLNPIIKIPLEEALNVNTYRGDPIVGKRLESRPREMQYTEATSPTAVAIGQLLNLSPVRIEHMMRGIGSGTGDSVVSVIDGLMGKYKKDFPYSSQFFSDLPGGALTRPFAEGGASDEVDKLGTLFYEARDNSADMVRLFNDLKSRNPEAARELISDPEVRVAIIKNKPLSEIGTRLAALRKLRDQIKYYNPPDKKERLQLLFMQEKRLLEMGAELAQRPISSSSSPQS
jgi:hypothetical protein